jgi:hypothetical protein
MLYVAAFHIRRVAVTLLTCILVASASMLLMLIPVPIPQILNFVLIFLLPIAVAHYYVEADLFPNVVGIVVSVEVLFMFVNDYLLPPLIQLFR